MPLPQVTPLLPVPVQCNSSVHAPAPSYSDAPRALPTARMIFSDTHQAQAHCNFSRLSHGAATPMHLATQTSVSISINISTTTPMAVPLVAHANRRDRCPGSPVITTAGKIVRRYHDLRSCECVFFTAKIIFPFRSRARPHFRFVHVRVGSQHAFSRVRWISLSLFFAHFHPLRFPSTVCCVCTSPLGKRAAPSTGLPNDIRFPMRGTLPPLPTSTSPRSQLSWLRTQHQQRVDACMALIRQREHVVHWQFRPAFLCTSM